ncbi:MAG: VOC family protein [Pasteurellaceae bacterium]|nr:VOC family protein [Pasteurellaceae bacterium]
MQNLNVIHPLFHYLPELGEEFPIFEQRISALARGMQLELNHYEIDHLALRVNNLQRSKIWLTAFLKCGKILSDNMVNGRVIYLIQLVEPLVFLGQKIDIIELPLPKNKQYPQQTWEHIEVVMPFLPNESTEQWLQRIENQFLWGELSSLAVKVSVPKVVGELFPNPSVAVSLKEQSNNHTTIKVHPFNIKKVIEV